MLGLPLKDQGPVTDPVHAVVKDTADTVGLDDQHKLFLWQAVLQPGLIPFRVQIFLLVCVRRPLYQK